MYILYKRVYLKSERIYLNSIQFQTSYSRVVYINILNYNIIHIKY